MQALYIRTAFGDREISERRHALTRWQRTVLIVVGAGKRLQDLQQELRQMPDKLEFILHELIEHELIVHRLVTTPTLLLSRPDKPIPENAHATIVDPLKDHRRHLTYLISIIENADAAAALGLTIKLKKLVNLEDIKAVQPMFHENLSKILGEEEAQRLLAKLALD